MRSSVVSPSQPQASPMGLKRSEQKHGGMRGWVMCGNQRKRWTKGYPEKQSPFGLLRSPASSCPWVLGDLPAEHRYRGYSDLLTSLISCL